MSYRTAESKPSATECRTCLGPHDDATHAATLAVRQWFRKHVTRHLPPEIQEPHTRISAA